jgi:integrase
MKGGWLVALISDTGMRLSEVAGLHKDDIKFDHIDLIQDITGFGGDNYLECTCLAK